MAPIPVPRGDLTAGQAGAAVGIAILGAAAWGVGRTWFAGVLFGLLILRLALALLPRRR